MSSRSSLKLGHLGSKNRSPGQISGKLCLLQRSHFLSNHHFLSNKTKQLIRQAKCKYFSNSITNSKDTKSLWNHLGDVNNGGKTASSNSPEKLIIGNETITESEAVVSKLNKYFASVAKLLNEKTSSGSSLDFDTNEISDLLIAKCLQTHNLQFHLLPWNKFYYILIP